MTEQLKALAEAAKGWNVNHAMPQRILALIAENERLQLWANRFKALRDMECDMCPPDKLSYYINNYDELDKHIARVNVASSELGETK